MIVFAKITGDMISKESETLASHYDITLSFPQPCLLHINANFRDSQMECIPATSVIGVQQSAQYILL
jgi:hypothetical protein